MCVHLRLSAVPFTHIANIWLSNIKLDKLFLRKPLVPIRKINKYSSDQMPTTVEIKGEFEIKIKQLIDAGLYGNIAEAVRDALRHMLREYDEKEIAVGLYRQGKVSLAKAAAIAGVSITRMKGILVEKGINPRLGVEVVKELYEDYETLKGTSD